MLRDIEANRVNFTTLFPDLAAKKTNTGGTVGLNGTAHRRVDPSQSNHSKSLPPPQKPRRSPNMGP